MPYSFRNRDEIKAPTRLDDPENERRRTSYREPDVDGEVFRSSPPKSSRIKYRGPVTHFNPNLPPAAFPTRDDPKLARHQQTKIIEDDYSSLDSGNSPAHDRLSVTGGPLIGRNVQNGRNGHTSHFPTENSQLRIDQIFTYPRTTPPITTKSTRMGSATEHPSRRTMRKDLSWLRGLRPQHDGTADSILEDNMRRMHAAGKLTSFDRNILEMVSSEDEGEDEEDVPQQEVRWDDLAPGLKLQLYDIISDAYPSTEATHKLRLKDIQVEELTNFVFMRNERLRKEDEEGSRHRREVHEKLLRGARLSGGKFRELLDSSLFQHVREGDDHGYYDNAFLGQATNGEKARLYLTQCHLNSRLLDGAWASIAEAGAIALGCAKGNDPSFEASTEDLLHPLGRDPYDASDNPRSPSRDPRLHARQRTQPPIQRSRDVTREPDRGRDSSGFIRPSIELNESTAHQPRLPPIGDFVHRPGLVRIELIRARKAAIEANSAAVDRQINEATSKNKAMAREAALSAQEHQGVKRRASTDLETSFLNNERRPGARQPKLTEKAVDAGVALASQSQSQSQSMATVHKKKRTSGGPTREDTTSAGSVTSEAAGSNVNGMRKGASQMTLQKPTRPNDRFGRYTTGEGTSLLTSAMIRKDSAIVSLQMKTTTRISSDEQDG